MADQDHSDEIDERLKKHSKSNIDEYIQTSTISDDELHEVSRILEVHIGRGVGANQSSDDSRFGN